MFRSVIAEAVEATPRNAPAKSATHAISNAIKRRNTMLDHFFYDVDALTPQEIDLLVEEDNAEGAVIVVHPAGAKGELGVEKFDTYEELVAAPGDKLAKFAISGVGSTDLGAAALARNLADHTGVPVGAIVAGYGIMDLVSEAMGGWFFFGSANRAMQSWHELTSGRRDRMQSVERTLTKMERGELTPDELSLTSDLATGFSPDTMTLIRLLTEKERRIDTIIGHSKGCLSIAFALETLSLLKDAEAIEKAKAARIMTLGAVVELPEGYDNVVQVIGGIDTFGGINSRLGKKPVIVPGAWHSLNRNNFFQLNIADVLSGYLQ